MKKIFLSITVVIVAIAFCSTGCSKENELSLKGGTAAPDCDTSNMKYSTDIVPILQASCYSCHGNGNTGGSGGISLDSYADLKKWADNGFLVGDITHATGFTGMPFGRPKLDDCTIGKIVSWVNNGSPNN